MSKIGTEDVTPELLRAMVWAVKNDAEQSPLPLGDTHAAICDLLECAARYMEHPSYVGNDPARSVAWVEAIKRFAISSWDEDIDDLTEFLDAYRSREVSMPAS